MKDHSLIFKPFLVRSLLEDRKTQTRRLLKPQPPSDCVAFHKVFNDAPYFEARNADGQPCIAFKRKGHMLPYPAINVNIGDRIWVRENWRCNGWATDKATIFYQASEGDGYTAMCEQYPVEGKKPLRVTGGWRPSIHMPRWASRMAFGRGRRLFRYHQDQCR